MLTQISSYFYKSQWFGTPVLVVLPTIEKPLSAVNTLPIEWLQPPASGEVFDDIKMCDRRLQGFSLAEGFSIVKKGAGTEAHPGARYRCKHHGIETLNTRKLSDRIERDEKGNIISSRKREMTEVGQADCCFDVAVSWKSIGKRNSGLK